MVYLAEHMALSSYRAIKRISKSHTGYQQLMQEVHILKSLKHPNIPIVYDIEEDENYSYIIEEYLEGESLKAYRLRLSNLSEKSVLDFTFQICDLIQYLHSFQSGILYLDLKPENIIVYQGRLKLLDFGAAIYQKEYKSVEKHFGTKVYMAPERLENQADQRSDIYSIGCLIYFLVTGSNYQPSQVSRKWIWIFVRNHGFFRIMERCLQSNPDKRFQSVPELWKSLYKLRKSGKFSNQSVISYQVAVAGSESRVGVTHIALLLARYAMEMNQNCVYVEWNQQSFLKKVDKICPAVKKVDNFYKLEHIRMIDRESFDDLSETSFQMIIKDYGVLNDENQKEFLEEELPILVLGTLPWEWEHSLHCLRMFCDCEQVLFLPNCANKVSSKHLEKELKGYPYVSVPYLTFFNQYHFSRKERKFLDSVMKYVVFLKERRGKEKDKNINAEEFL